MRDITQEVNFWDSFFEEGQHIKYSNAAQILDDDLLAVVKKCKKRCKLLNAGAGAFHICGYKCPSKIIKITSTDVLAKEYSQLWEKYKIDHVIPIENADMENLPYENGSFDVVFVGNALDHTENAFHAVQELVRVCKEGGIVYLRHFRDVRELEGGKGLHQWNIHVNEENDLILEGENCSYNINQSFPFKNKWVINEKGHNFIFSILQK